MTESDIVYQDDLEENQWYRRVRDRDTAHLWAGEGTDTLCDLSLWMEDKWWAASVWEGLLGEQWVVKDARAKGKQCSTCRVVKAQTQKKYTVTTLDWTPMPSTTNWPRQWWEQGTHTSQLSPSDTKLLRSWYTARGWTDLSAPF